MNTLQRKIANEVRERGDDYFLTLKEGGHGRIETRAAAGVSRFCAAADQ